MNGGILVLGSIANCSDFRLLETLAIRSENRA